MDMGFFFLQKERIFPGVHKIGAAMSGPRIADKKTFTDSARSDTAANANANSDAPREFASVF